MSPSSPSAFESVPELRLSGRVRSHEGVVGRGPVGEAREGAGRLADAAGHRRRVAAEGGGHRQVGELRVEVPQVGGTGLENRADRKSELHIH